VLVRKDQGLFCCVCASFPQLPACLHSLALFHSFIINQDFVSRGVRVRVCDRLSCETSGLIWDVECQDDGGLGKVDFRDLVGLVGEWGRAQECLGVRVWLSQW
jgi:hypothetical protein